MERTLIDEVSSARNLLCEQHAWVWFNERKLVKRPACGCLVCGVIAEDIELRARICCLEKELESTKVVAT